MSARRHLRRGTALAALLAVAGGLGALTPSCSNPVQDAQIEALGPEVNGVPPGPDHRPGQPCLVCHSKYGGKKPEFVIGGTVFADAPGVAKAFKPVSGVEVVLTDSVGESRTVTTTGCNGNFYITATSWNPRFPLAVEIHYPVYDPATGMPQMDLSDPAHPKEIQKVKAMGSVISRNGSCAACHKLSGRSPATDSQGSILDYDSTGWIYCNATGDSNFFPDPMGCIPPPWPPKSSSSSTSGTSTGAGG